MGAGSSGTLRFANTAEGHLEARRHLQAQGGPFLLQPYLAEVESGGAVAGCAFRTPPHSLGLTRMPPEAVAPLVASVADTYAELPGVVGPEPEATAFAEGWRAARGGCGRAWRAVRYVCVCVCVCVCI